MNFGKLFNINKPVPVEKGSSIAFEGVQDWLQLEEYISTTTKGQELIFQKQERNLGRGDTHVDAKFRLFDAKSEDDINITFYRDTAAWCPYCQKVLILLEEKRIPHRIEKINMRSYGDKPESFLRKVKGGLLPAIEIDGKIQTESVDIMINLDRMFNGDNHISMWPSDDENEKLEKAIYCMRLERQLFSEWCGLVFRPAIGNRARNTFEMTMHLVDRELGKSKGPWFLGDKNPSIVDLQYITHIERMAASVPYWSGFKIRGDNRFPNIEKWMDAFEERSTYMATKSDYYTHVMDIPPQYGPGYSVFEAKTYAETIDGINGSWDLPLKELSTNDIEPISSKINPGDDSAKLEAAYKLINNRSNILKFALRGDGEKGMKQFQAPLADPYAEPNLNLEDQMDYILKIIVNKLIGNNDTKIQIKPDDITKAGLIKCIDYLKIRIGVPRDMSYPAARQLRAHLNWIKKEI